MSLSIHCAGSSGFFDYAIVGRGTACVRSDRQRFSDGSYRAFLSRIEGEILRRSLRLTQFAFYLPNLVQSEDPVEIALASVSFVRRFPELVAAYAVAPQHRYLSIMMDVVGRKLPGFEVRFLDDPERVATHLRARDPDLPPSWYELPREALNAATP